MWRISAMRIVQAVPLLFIVSALAFFLQLFIPGDAARAIGGLQASPQAIAALRHSLHLDDPVWVRSLVLPVCARMFAGMTVIAKQAREQLDDVMSRDFVRNLRANGVSERSILFKHALRHISITVLTVASNNLIGLLGAAVIIE